MHQIPDAFLLPIAQASPTGHPRSAARFLRQHLPRSPAVSLPSYIREAFRFLPGDVARRPVLPDPIQPEPSSPVPGPESQAHPGPEKIALVLQFRQ